MNKDNFWNLAFAVTLAFGLSFFIIAPQPIGESAGSAIRKIAREDPVTAGELFLDFEHAEFWDNEERTRYQDPSWESPLERIITSWFSKDFDAVNDWVGRLQKEEYYDCPRLINKESNVNKKCPYTDQNKLSPLSINSHSRIMLLYAIGTVASLIIFLAELTCFHVYSK